MTAGRCFWGVDCGSTEIKVVACDAAGAILHKGRRRTLFPLVDHVRDALAGDGSFESPLDGGAVRPGHFVTATGYGRAHIPFAQEKLTEIRAHHLGVRHQARSVLGPEDFRDYTIVDIGGQDSKVIVVRDDGVHQFVINRKCAAGTGAFIEELAHRLELRLEDLPRIEGRHDADLTLNSYCTVFAGQEVIKVLMNGEKVENLIHALYRSVLQRVLEMTAIRSPLIVFSGGVLGHHEPLRRLFGEKFRDRRLILAPEAQFCGAVGAAIHGIQHETGEVPT